MRNRPVPPVRPRSTGNVCRRRAGEAGKGFAVVTNEVEEPAQETARATEDIGHRVDTIQSDTAGAVTAVTAITEIVEIIGRISDHTAAIAAAVELARMSAQPNPVLAQFPC
jgi:methyl-accepting chemotaxis protein